MYNSVNPIMIYEGESLTRLTTQLHQHMQHFGYQHTQVPAIAEADVFLNKAGDQIAANLLTFNRFGQQLALRPEFTALAALRYAQNYPNGDKTVRWQFNGSVFLDNYDQRNQDYQHMTVGAELFGMRDTAYADAEVLHMATAGMTQVAQLPAVAVQMGHIGLLRSLVDQYDLDDRVQRFVFDEIGALASGATSVEALLDKFDNFMTYPVTGSTGVVPDSSGASTILDVMLDATQSGNTMGGRTRQDITRRLLKKRQRTAQRPQLVDALHHLKAWLSIGGVASQALSDLRQNLSKGANTAKDVIDTLEKTLELTEHMGTDTSQIQFNPGLVRSWNYYTGMTFELVAEDGAHLGGGGRYDDLVALVSNAEGVPAVGFVYDVTTIIERTSASRGANTQPIQFSSNQPHHPDAIAVIRELRRAGFAVAVVEGDSDHESSDQVLQYRDGILEHDGRTYPTTQLADLIHTLTSDGSDK